MSKDFSKIPSCSRRELLDNTAFCLFSIACRVKDDSRSLLLEIASRLVCLYVSSVYHKVHNWRIVLDCLSDLSRLFTVLSSKDYDKEV